MDSKQPIPAISIRQPWAELILRGQKSIEMRRWTDPYRGDLYLHTGLMADGYRHIEYGMPDVFRGGYVGMIKLVAIRPFTPETWDKWRDRHLDEGAFQPGWYAWILHSPRRLARPVPAAGKPGIFYPSPEIRELLEQESGEE